MDAVKLLGNLLGKNATGGNLLGSLLGGDRGGTNVGGGANPLSGMLGGLLGSGDNGQSSGIAGILGSILGAGGTPQASGGGLAGLVGGLLGGNDAPTATQAPPKQAVDEATLLIRAMCNAAKADGEIDRDEQEQIIGRLGGDIDQEEAEFIRNELSKPLNVAEFCNSVPSSMAAKVYALSAMTVRVDTREEVAYLSQLVDGLNLDSNTLAQIHKQLGLA